LFHRWAGLIADETVKRGKVIKLAGIKAQSSTGPRSEEARM
jgi:hypothetical protein